MRLDLICPQQQLSLVHVALTVDSGQWHVYADVEECTVGAACKRICSWLTMSNSSQHPLLYDSSAVF